MYPLQTMCLKRKKRRGPTVLPRAGCFPMYVDVSLVIVKAKSLRLEAAAMSRWFQSVFLAISATALLRRVRATAAPSMRLNEQQQEKWDNAVPSITAVSPDVANRCSSFDLASMSNGRACGSPYSSPCFDFSRCLDRPTIYVYDPQVILCKPLQAGA